MDIKLDINPAEIQEAVSKAIIDSSIGDSIKKAIESLIKNEYKFNRVIEGQVESHFSAIIRDWLMKDETIRDKVKALISDKLTDEAMSILVNKLWDNMINKW